ncbi:MAG: PKD domain-containing protein [Candidatus Thermoplasmatota archaeon]|nr:PKD domain-containing protein [Candidatus Thermoplasmatota archaeon]
MIFSVFSGISGSDVLSSAGSPCFEPWFSAGSGTASDPYKISNITELQWMGNTSNLDKHFILVNDIDASVTKTLNSGAGFVPIGNSTNIFTGNLDGNGYNITDLFINRSSTDYIGLFGYIGNGTSVKDLNLVRFNITGGNYVGGLVGRNGGTVTNCSARGNTSGSIEVGGLVGLNYGIVTNCYATGNTSGNVTVGGLVGYNSKTLMNCSAIGNTNGTDIIGGLVGYNSGTVTNCSADGNTSGSSEVGGLVGYNYWIVTDCYALGNTSGSNLVGGLVGYNMFLAVTNCYAISDTSGFSEVGGLIGRNGGILTNCSVDGNTSGIDEIGGLVGYNSGTVTNCSAIGITNGSNMVGGLVGNNSRTVANCYALGNTSGISFVGGLVGYNEHGTATNCYTTGNTCGVDFVSGLVGFNSGTVTDCYTAGNTSGISFVGGLVGSNYMGTVTNCYATGNTSGADSVGGLVGDNFRIENIGGAVAYCQTTGNTFGNVSVGGLVGINRGGTVTHCFATGNTSGNVSVGGLVGRGGGIVMNCYATGNTNGNVSVGGLIGNNYFGTVTNCYASGNIKGTGSHVGGLVGNNSEGTVSNCYAAGKTNGNSSVGGLVGGNMAGTLTNCYAAGNVSGNQQVGGLMGVNWYGTVRDSYAMVTVTRSSGADTSFGGFVGSNYRGTILKCYSTGKITYSDAADPNDKGFAGSVDTGVYYEMTGNFWDNQTSGQNSTAGKATGKNTTEMITIDTFANVGWDIVHVRDHVSETWYIDEGYDYPRLYWEPYVDQYPPIADAGPDQTVNVGTEVTFNGRGSSDNIRIVNWTWTFFNGYPVTIYGIGSIYVFNDPGMFIVTLNVTDAAGNWNEDTMKVTVLDITPPIADAGPDQIVDEGTIIAFDGSGSSDNIGVVNWTWTFNDGMENIILFGSAPYHTFNVPGTYIVILNVTDAAGNWATDTMTVTVNDITPPVANAGPDQVVVMGDTVRLDGTGSSDNVGIVNFTWNFTDIIPVTMYGAQPEYTFNNHGEFMVTLIVTDAEGNWFSDTMIVRVDDMIPPVADAGSDMVVEAGTLVLLNGSGSHDNVGISNYTWKFFYGNDYIALYGVDPQFKFHLLGIFIVTLYVTDDAGWRDEDEVIVTVKDTTPPHADAGPDQIVHQGDLVVFNAAGSYDNSGIVDYKWTFKDGINDVILYDVSPKYRFGHAGVFNVMLEVTDEAGLWDTDNVIITIVVSRFSVHGNVLDENGDPVEGVKVEINATDGETYITVTGSDGSFSMEVPKGPFTWRISKEGYEELSGESSTDDLGEITIKLKESPMAHDDDATVIILFLVSLVFSILIVVGIVLFFISRRRKEVFMEE